MSSGSCVCKAITLKVTGEPEQAVVCYCTDCRKMSGNLSHIIGAYKSNNVSIEDPQGKLKTYTISNTASGKPNYVHFCGDCATVFTTVPTVYENTTMVRTPVLDDYEKVEPTSAIFKDERCSWHDKLHKL